MGQQKGNPTPSYQNQAYETLYPNTNARENRDYGTKPVMIDDNLTLNDVVDVSFATDAILTSVSSSIDSYISTKASAASVTAISSSFASIVPLNLITGSCTNDSEAASAGVPVGGLYHTAGAVKVRLT